MERKNFKTGFGLMEVVVAAAVISVSIFSLMSVAKIYSDVVSASGEKVKAGFLLEEGVEAVKILRDSGWAGNIAPLNPSAVYYLVYENSTWKPTTTKIYIDGIFERSFTLEDVYRNLNDDISSSGNLDSYTKKISVSVSWREKSGTTTRSISAYIADIF